ncbi:hypothetical protein IU486_16070 [Streptomyces gardneri]|uniref:alcohol dehydrogenase catalytic domain-containing protein n=1 Tax=Nocardia sputi TaxID=2943705 RepID=UPI001893FB8F|nr:hypothetical protein [Nocardia sputi]MBF6166263.1 hypothetical protein [Streptomyces gardneri]MBF6205675.1 hypothetical protein [Streptomyces gardneri]
MKALISRAYGPAEKLSFADVPVPVPGPEQVLVRAAAAALNPIDIKLVTVAVRKVFPITHPFVPGVDITGVVTRVAVYTGTVPAPGRLDALAGQAARGALRVMIGATHPFRRRPPGTRRLGRTTQPGEGDRRLLTVPHDERTDMTACISAVGTVMQAASAKDPAGGTA